MLVYIFAGLESPIVDFFILMFYLISPMFTLYITNFVTASNFFNPVMDKNTVTVPNIWGAQLTCGFAIGMFVVQTIVYFYITLTFDERR